MPETKQGLNDAACKLAEIDRDLRDRAARKEIQVRGLARQMQEARETTKRYEDLAAASRKAAEDTKGAIKALEEHVGVYEGEANGADAGAARAKSEAQKFADAIKEADAEFKDLLDKADKAREECRKMRSEAYKLAA